MPHAGPYRDFLHPIAPIRNKVGEVGNKVATEITGLDAKLVSVAAEIPRSFYSLGIEQGMATRVLDPSEAPPATGECPFAPAGTDLFHKGRGTPTPGSSDGPGSFFVVNAAASADHTRRTTAGI